MSPPAPPEEQRHPPAGKTKIEKNFRNPSLSHSLTNTRVKPAEQVTLPRDEEPFGLMKDARGQQIQDMLTSFVSMFCVITQRWRWYSLWNLSCQSYAPFRLLLTEYYYQFPQQLQTHAQILRSPPAFSGM